MVVQILSIAFFAFAVVSAWMKIKERKKGNEHREFGWSVALTVVSIALVVLQIFASPSAQNNYTKTIVDDVKIELNTKVQNVSTQIETINESMSNMEIRVDEVQQQLMSQSNVYGPNIHVETMQVGLPADGETLPINDVQLMSETYPMSVIPTEQSTPVLSDDFYYLEKDSFQTGWNDSNNGREKLTIQEVNDGAIDGKIVFNSLIDNPSMNEFNFISAREYRVNDPDKNPLWHTHLEAKKSKTYLVRLFTHNNSRLGTDAIAEGVRVRYNISPPVHATADEIHDVEGFSSENGYWAVAINGWIYTDNADPKEYYYAMKFVSNKPFHLEYVPGSALFQNNELGLISLSDDIMSESGVMIGYDALDGRIPGCFQYSSYSMIKVYPVFE